MVTINTSAQEDVYCNICGSSTLHKSRGECKAESQVTDEPSCVVIRFVDTYTLLQCGVCGQAQLRKIEWNSENEEGPAKYFPPPHVRRPPAWLPELDEPHRKLLGEVYAAMDVGLYGVALMGVRAILDVWVSSQTSHGNDFPKKLEAIAALGSLSARQVQILVSTFDAGSAAAHRGYRPNLDDVTTAADAIENLLQQDLLGPRMTKLRANTPPRHRK